MGCEMSEKKVNNVDNVVRYSPMEIPFLVMAHWNAKVPLHFIAEPSTVKSEGTVGAARQIAESEQRVFFEWNRRSMEEKRKVLAEPEKYFVFADIRASETDIGELRLQNMKDTQGYMTFIYNIVFEVLSKSSAMGILFFDEMNLAPNMIKAQFYKVINDRAIGDIPLSDGVLCVSAGNEAEHSRGVTEDPVPLVLRRGNYFLRPLTGEEYTDYASRTGQHQWIIGYLGFQPNDVHLIEYDLPDSVGQPCPRTWTRFSQILQANPRMSLREVEIIANGLVGQGVAKKFIAFVKSAQGIDLNAILAKPSLIREYEKELSLLYAVFGGVVGKFRDDKKVIKPAFEIALEVARPELGAYMLRSIKNTDEKSFMKAGGSDKMIPDDIVKKVVERYAKFLFKD